MKFINSCQSEPVEDGASTITAKTTHIHPAFGRLRLTGAFDIMSTSNDQADKYPTTNNR